MDSPEVIARKVIIAWLSQKPTDTSNDFTLLQTAIANAIREERKKIWTFASFREILRNVSIRK